MLTLRISIFLISVDSYVEQEMEAIDDLHPFHAMYLLETSYGSRRSVIVLLPSLSVAAVG